jgi:hypothetical protein
VVLQLVLPSCSSRGWRTKAAAFERLLAEQSGEPLVIRTCAGCNREWAPRLTAIAEISVEWSWRGRAALGGVGQGHRWVRHLLPPLDGVAAGYRLRSIGRGDTWTPLPYVAAFDCEGVRLVDGHTRHPGGIPSPLAVRTGT